MTDLGPLHYFLGIFVSRDDTGMFLCQRKYALKILERAGMLNCQPCRTPVDTESKLDADGPLVFDLTLYRSLAGALQYLTFTGPDLSYTVQQICLFMHDPREPQKAALKRILRYIRGTLDYGLQLYSASPLSLIDIWMQIGPVHQATLSRLSAEAEYHGVANVVAETAWLRNLLRELHSPLARATLVYCDNASAVAAGHVRVLHVPSRYHFADIFTKCLPYALFDDFRSNMSVRPSFVPTTRGCR
ncbi:ribonuclease H-like domain-containing protein [Tanacetum coccineum]